MLIYVIDILILLSTKFLLVEGSTITLVSGTKSMLHSMFTYSGAVPLYIVSPDKSSVAA